MGIRAAIAVLAVLAAFAPGASEAAGKSCAKTGGTLMRNATVRVYDVGQKVYACHVKSRRRTYLTRYRPGREELDDYRSFIRPRLAGRFVAFGDEFGCNRLGDCGGTIRVVDARTGEDLYVAGVTVPAGAPSGGGVPRLPALHLKASGAAAYVIGPTFDTPWEVWRLDADGEQRLDSGNVDPASFATNADRVYWMRDGQPQTATWR